MRITGTFEAEAAVKTANFTCGDDCVYLCDATAGNITATLPGAAGEAVSTRFYVFKKTDSGVNTVTIDGNGAEVIDGATTYVLSTQYQFVVLFCDGVAWHIIGSG